MATEAPERQLRSSRNSSTAENKAKDARRTAQAASAQAVAAASSASAAVGKAVDGAADALGGWKELDKYVKSYNPTLYEFIEKSFLKKIGATSKASKFLVCLFGLGVLQSTVPLFAWPLDTFAHLLSFVFLYNSGADELRAGFGSSESRAYKIKSLLTVYLIVSLFEIVPAFAFDTVYHFGALWNFLLPALLFVTPDRKNPKETLAVWIADSVFAQVSSVIESVVPDAFVGSDQTTTFLAAGLLALLLWIGFLGSSGSYLAVNIFLFISTTHHLGKDFISPTESSSGFAAQMTIWHNLLAIWLWRHLISAVESIAIPGLISVRGWITYHLPSYYLWITALFFSMLLTKKTASSGKANTWYASWLSGKTGSSAKKSSRGESGSGKASSSSRSSSSSSSSRSSKSPK